MKTHPSDFVTLTYQAGFAPGPADTDVRIPSSSILYVYTHSGGATVIWAEQNNLKKKIFCTETPATIAGNASTLITFTDAETSTVIYVNANRIHFVGSASATVAAANSHIIYDEGQIKKKWHATQTQSALVTAINATDPGGDYVDLTSNQNPIGGEKVWTSVAEFTTEVVFSGIAPTMTAKAGGGQAGHTVTQLINDHVFITTVASPGDSVILPTVTAGGRIKHVKNEGANACDVFPESGGQINSLGVDAPYSLAAGNTIKFVNTAAGTWKTMDA